MRGTRQWRDGIRVCTGILWDTTCHEASEGRFVIKIKPDAEEGSAFSYTQRHAVLEVTPVAVAESPVEDNRPVLCITLSMKGNFFRFYRPAFAAFAGRRMTGAADTRLRVLINSELASFAGDPLFPGLRGLGRTLAAVGGEAMQVRLVVFLPETREADVDAGFGSGPSMVGGMMTGAMGLGPAAGIIAGAALNSAGPTSPDGRKEMLKLIDGSPNGPREDCLRSVAAEFGWTVDAPGV